MDKVISWLASLNPGANYPLVEVYADCVKVRVPFLMRQMLVPGESVTDALVTFMERAKADPRLLHPMGLAQV